MADLIVGCGVSGAGKSYYFKSLKNKFKNMSLVIVSRDEIRFSFLKEEDDYFDHEDEVWEIFIEKINEALREGDTYTTVVADATHLTPKSRAKLLKRIDRKYVNKIIAVWFNIPLGICMERNNKREGRAWVKPGIIKRMFYSASIPTFAEGFDVIQIIDQNDVITEKEKDGHN